MHSIVYNHAESRKRGVRDSKSATVGQKKISDVQPCRVEEARGEPVCECVDVDQRVVCDEVSAVSDLQWRNTAVQSKHSQMQSRSWIHEQQHVQMLGQILAKTHIDGPAGTNTTLRQRYTR